MIYERYLGKYCLVRSDPAGVFAGVLKAIDKDCCILTGVRRIYYWAGAFTLSQFCQEGVKLVDRCKFSNEVPEQGISGVIEILPCSDAAIESIKGIPVWKVQEDELGRYTAMAIPAQREAARQDFSVDGYGDGTANGGGNIDGCGGEGGLQITELGFGEGSGSGSGHGYGDGTGDGAGRTIGKGSIAGHGSEWTDFRSFNLE